MLSWLILSWSLTLGYIPLDNPTMFQASGENIQSICNEGVLSTELALKAEAFNHIRLSTSIESRETKSEKSILFGAFDPYEAYFKLGFCCYFNNFEIGITHECDHGIEAPNTPRPWLSNGNTNLYLKFSGTTQF
jgi:hypothetical protein